MIRTCHLVNTGQLCLLVGMLISLAGCAAGDARPSSDDQKARPEKECTRADALRMIQVSEGRLSPVYGPLAEQLVEDLGLSDKVGVGIDIGSGPGTLILELCKRTKMHWIDADINPHFFPYFFRQAEERGYGGRVSAVRADAQALPFRDDYADVIVSRGSFWLWGDKVKAFGEVLRVLKPGGVAYIGRGLSANLPLQVAKKVRGKSGGPKYDVAATAEELHSLMKTLGVKQYRIIRPRLDNAAGVNYGVWVEFRKQ